MGIANQTPVSVATEYAALRFIVEQLVSGMGTATLVRVAKCTNAGGLVPAGTVDLQLLVDMVTEDGQTIPHGTVFQAPYVRMQGGANAVILDPQPGDLGLCVFASRDITAIKADPAAALARNPPGAPPGSRRTFSLSDALYVGGMLNGVPTQYVVFDAEGVKVVSPLKVTLQAPDIELDGNVLVTGATVGIGEITGNGIPLSSHKHTGVQAGGANSGGPIP